MNILDLLKQDHRKVESLFAEIEKSNSATQLQKLFEQIYLELTTHTQGEELTFYPAMREYEDTEQLLEEAEQEHVEAEVLLEEIRSMGTDSSDFKDKIQELKAAVMHHVQEEENNLFSQVRECMDDEELEQLAQEFQDAKGKIQEDLEISNH